MFWPAVSLGLTATPKRKTNADTYAYFGDPVYSYPLKPPGRLACARELQLDARHFYPVQHGWIAQAMDRPHSSIYRLLRQGLPPQLGAARAMTPGRLANE